jgi:RNA polymerase sigma-70 factor, ECF subfamily
MAPTGEPGAADGAAERRAFECCFRDRYPDVLAFALRRSADRQAAEDAVAETFAVVWRQRDRIPAEPLPWLYAIAVRVLANQRRSQRRRSNLEERLAHEAGAGEPVSDPAETLDRRRAFAAAFSLLSEAEREVLSLVAWEGLGPRDAARVLGCSHGALRVRFHRARRKLAKHLAASGHPPHERRAPARNPAEEIS